jgi:hypothetical protein
MPDLDRLAEVAYEEYCLSCGGIAFNGDNLKKWNEVENKIKVHWRNAMQAVLKELDK